MAEFGSNVTSVEPVANSVRPQDGVVDKSATVTFAGVADLFEKAGTLIEGRKQSKQAAIIADFASKQLLIADALEQGTISSSIQARALARKNLLEAISANPTLAKDLIAADGSLTSLPGGTGVISEDTDTERRTKAERDRLVSEGLVAPNATDQEFETAAEQRRIAEAASKRHTERMNTLDLALKEENLSAAQRASLEAERKSETSRYIKDMVPAEQTRVKTEYDKILNDPNLSEADKVMAIEDFHNRWLAETSATLGSVESQEAQYMLKPFESLREAYLKRATGEIGDEELKRQNQRAVDLQKALILSDPDLAAVSASQELFGSNVITNLFTQNTPAGNKLLRLIAGNASPEGTEAPFVVDPNEKKAVSGYLNGVLEGLKSTDPAMRTNAEQHLTKFLSSVEDYEGLVRSDPRKAIEVVNWFGSAAFLAARKENPELFENMSGAIDVLSRHYADEVWGMVQREFVNNEVVFGTDLVDPNTPMAQAGADPATTGAPTTSQIGARATAGGMEFFALAEDAPQSVRDQVRDLNKNLKPVINNTVKAFAHLEGRTDYGAMFEETASQLLGNEAIIDGGDAEDDFTLEEFSMPKVSAEALPEQVQQDTEFLDEVSSLAKDLDIQTSDILAVMDFETGGSFSPAQRNAAGSSATGLIQFMAKTAESLGTTTEELAGMTRKDQMKYVRDYFMQFKDEIKGGDTREVYMAVLFPKAIGKSGDYALFREGTTAYAQNKGLDRNGDGIVTKDEAARKVVQLVGKYANS